MALFYLLQFRTLQMKFLFRTKRSNTAILYLLSFIFFSNYSQASSIDKTDLSRAKVEVYSEWEGKNKVKKDIPILILAGHADSQGIAGAGTSGEAVDLKGKKPMDPKISDELFWNLKIQKAIVSIGKQQGLNIAAYDPGKRNIINGNDPRTNWSKGSIHNQKGGYALEIHFDSYGEYGFGSGLIPALSTKLNTIDESLARSFGRYPMFFRGGLGAPRRGIRILEIAKLEGQLEQNLRNESSRDKTINLIAREILRALKSGLNNT